MPASTAAGTRSMTGSANTAASAIATDATATARGERPPLFSVVIARSRR